MTIVLSHKLDFSSVHIKVNVEVQYYDHANSFVFSKEINDALTNLCPLGLVNFECGLYPFVANCSQRVMLGICSSVFRSVLV